MKHDVQNEATAVVDAAQTPSTPLSHPNPRHTGNTTDEERAEMLSEYLEAIKEDTGDIRLMPLRDGTKEPERGRWSLDEDSGRSRLVSGEKAVRCIGESGAWGFALYPGNPDHGTEDIVVTDHDDTDLWPPEQLPETLRVVSGSGTGCHLTFVNGGDVEGSSGTGDMDDAGEVRANNQMVVVPGSKHPSLGIYYVDSNPGLATLHSDDLPDGLLPSSGSSSSPDPIDPENIQQIPTEFDPDEVTNEFGCTLREIRRISPKLNCLLTGPNAVGYPSTSEADMGTISLLLYWRFEDPDDLANVLRYCRPRDKMHRDEYVSRTIKTTSHTKIHPIDHDLGRALVANAKENGWTPEVGPETLAVVKSAIQILEKDAKDTTTANIADLLSDRGSTRGAVERRARRATELLEDAGYVRHEKSEEDGRILIYRDDGLDGLLLPTEV